MRVGLVAPVWCSVPPVGYGGTEQVVDALARGLAGQGHEVVLAATGDSTCPVEVRSLLPSPAPSMLDGLSELRHVAFAVQALGDCDVVHDHTLAGPLTALRRPSAPPWIATCHGLLADELGAYYRQLAGSVHVVAISHAQAAAAPGLAHAVVHHGVVPEDFPVGRGDGGYLLLLGRMSPDKGVAEGIAVARRTRTRLLVAAKMREEPEVQYFEEQVRPDLGGGVEYVGEVAGQDKLGLLGGATGLLMPIRWSEPFGMVMVEALACGTPVLAFAQGAAPEVVEHGRTGFLCRDVAEMARAVGRLPELSRDACREAVEERWSARRMASEYLEVYRSALRDRVARTQPLHAPRQAGDLDVPPVVDLDVEPGAAQRDPAHRE